MSSPRAYIGTAPPIHSGLHDWACVKCENALNSQELKPDQGWAPAWDHPNRDHFIIGHSMQRTRSEAWNGMLKLWFLHVQDSTGADLYYPAASRGPTRTITRDVAIHRLKRKGLRVIRVKVVSAVTP